MVAPADRFSGWIESLSEKWKERFRGWAAGVIGFGIEVFMDVLGKSFAPKLKPLMDKIESTATIPPELKPLWDEIKKPTGETAALMANRLGGGLVSGAISSIVDYLLRPIVFGMSRLPGFFLPKPEILIGIYYRYNLSKEYLYNIMRNHGIDPEGVDALLTMSQLRLPSDIVFPLIRRDPTKWGSLKDDLRQLGIDPYRIAALEEIEWKLPTAEQAITWMAREVFEEEMVTKYGLDDEAEKIDWSFMETIGIKEEVARKHWRAHWQHASWSQIVEMLHRGAVTEQDVYDWFRLVEIPPYWRKGLTQTMWSLPGRIEIRMMAQYGLIDKAKVKELLKKDGLAEEYLNLVADMNIVRGVRTDIQTRYTKGWLDSEGVKAEIAQLDLTPPMPERLYQWIVRNVKPDRTQAEKDLTKAEIVKAVKLGELGWLDGIDLLKAQGYDEDEADLILAIGIPVEAEILTDIQKLQIDTTRRLRRKQTITRETEVAQLIAFGLAPSLANAYADNDELRLAKVTTEETE